VGQSTFNPHPNPTPSALWQEFDFSLFLPAASARKMPSLGFAERSVECESNVERLENVEIAGFPALFCSARTRKGCPNPPPEYKGRGKFSVPTGDVGGT
jgi:hypothetical protein